MTRFQQEIQALADAGEEFELAIDGVRGTGKITKIEDDAVSVDFKPDHLGQEVLVVHYTQVGIRRS